MQNFHVHAMNSTWWKGAKEKGTNRATTRGPRASGWLFDANRYLTKLEEADFSLLSMPANVDFFHRAVRASLSLCLSIFGEEMKIFERASYIFISVSTSVELNLFGSGGGENERRGEKKEGRKRKKGILLNLIEAWILFRITLKLNRMRFNLGDRSRFYDWIS